ncbi:MAG: aldolase, partial [Candidatus Bathyarchaeia archaeon]
PEDRSIISKISPSEALRYVEFASFCNPHLLVKDERKTNMRRKFFGEFFHSIEEIYIVNTSAPIMESHRAIKEAILNHR